MEKLTDSLAHYMKAIHSLSEEHESVRISDLAALLGVSKPSACRAVNELEARGLVRRTLDRKIILTPEGDAQSAQLKHKFEKIRQFLVEILGVEEEIADQDAWALEHVMSTEGYSAFVHLLS